MRKLISIATCLLFPMSVTAQVSNPSVNLTQVESSEVTLDSSGNGTWTFTPAFNGIPSVTHLPKALDTTNPLICNFTSISATAVTIHCWRTALLGLLTGLLSGPTTGATVTLMARYRPPGT